MFGSVLGTHVSHMQGHHVVVTALTKIQNLIMNDL